MRVKRGIARHRKHQKLRSLAKGFRGMGRTSYRKAHETVVKAGQHAYIDRRRKKRLFRSLWIIRLNAALRGLGWNYSRMIKDLKTHHIELDRQTLSELAIHEPNVFNAIVQEIRS